MTDNELRVLHQERDESFGENVRREMMEKSRKRRRNRWIIIGVAVGLLSICTICSVALLIGVPALNDAQAEVEDVLNQFAGYMSQKNYEAAYALMSTRAQRQIPFEQIEELGEGANFVLFDQFLRVEVGSLYLNRAYNTDPDQPQGRVAEVSGVIVYANGYQGSFNAVLEKEDDIWKIDGFHITVSPEKMENYFENNN